MNTVSKEVKEALLPLKVIWFALTMSAFIYNFVILSKLNFDFSINLANVFNPLYLSTWFGFVFLYFLYGKRFSLIKESKIETTPYFLAYSEEGQRTLRFMPKYLVFHIFIWALNEMLMIIGFTFSFTTQDYSYLLYSSVFFLSLNIIFLRPRYLEFLSIKERMHE